MPKRTFSWVSPKVFIKKTKKKGYGAFARQDIPKGEVVAVAGGYVMKVNELNMLPKELYNLTFQVENDLYFGIRKKNEMEDNWRFNHSCEPNLGQRGQLSLVTMRKVKKGEELTFDYATVLCRPKGQKKWQMKCECGSKNCRGIVTDEDWKIPKLQKKYKGYFQYFLQEKINKNKS